MRFTVHSPAPRLEGSPRCHRPPGGDVPGRVHIRIQPQPTGHTPENRLALTALRRTVPAGRTGLRRVRGHNPLHPTGSLVLQPGHQQPPPLGQDRPIQPRLLPHPATRCRECPARRTGHVPDPQALHPNHIEPPRQIGRDLLHPVLAPVLRPRGQPRQRALDPRPTTRTPLAPCQPPPQPHHPTLLDPGQGRGVQQFPGGQRRRHRHTPIHPHHLTGAGRGNRSGDSSEGDMPPAGAIPGHPVGAHPVGNGTGPAEADPPELGHPYLPMSAVESPTVLGADPDLPEPLVLPGLAPRRPAMRTAEKVTQRRGEIPQRLLLHHLAASPQPRERRPGLGQLPRPLGVARRRRTPGPPVRMLLHRQIPHVAGMAGMLGQPDLLVRCGQQPVAGHHDHANHAHRQTRPPPRPDPTGPLPPRPEGQSRRRFEFR